MRVQSPPAVIAPVSPDSGSRISQRAPAGEVFSVSAAEASPLASEGNICHPSLTSLPQFLALDPSTRAERSPEQAVTAYRRVESLKKDGLAGDMAKYKDDQLLRNPGGDAYNLQPGNAAGDLAQHRSFTHRIGKDLSDGWDNCKKLFQNLTFGSETAYRDSSGQVRKSQRKGLLGTIGDFLKNTASALSFGFYAPEGGDKPSGIMEKAFHFVKKSKQALFGDLVQGVPAGINRMGKNLILAGWNLVEVLPDATIGHFDAGRKLTTTVFDDGQVMVEYLTDVIPGGEAWLRVHSASLHGLKPPILYNLSRPEHSLEDARWETVRNTPFRKTLETLGALLADVAFIGLLGQTLSNGHNREDRQSLE
jgi:hypothetical protein